MKPVILTFAGHYLPGYKAGGILHNFANTVNTLCHDFDFRIVTRDRDLGDITAYQNINKERWESLGNAMVYYLPPDSLTFSKLNKLIADTPHDLLYFTSFFEILTVKVLLCRRLGLIPNKPVIVQPNGEFCSVSLKQKYPKKKMFLQIAGLLGIYNGATWRAASKAEQDDIMRYMHVKPDQVPIVAYIPEKNMNPQFITAVKEEPQPGDEILKIIFLSRIAPGKNLHYALKILKKVKSHVSFDIYGPIEDARYWKKCQKYLSRLPGNIHAHYIGKLEHSKVQEVFSRYDLFFFPSAGEAYGMVIAESLAAGTTVLTSDKTAWTDLQSDNLGWDIPLQSNDEFAKIIDHCSSLTVEDRSKKRILVKNNVVKRLFDPGILEANFNLFHKAIGDNYQHRHQEENK